MIAKAPPSPTKLAAEYLSDLSIPTPNLTPIHPAEGGHSITRPYLDIAQTPGAIAGEAGREAAPIGVLQGVWLKRGANRRSPGSVFVDQALARLAGQVLENCGRFLLPAYSGG